MNLYLLTLGRDIRAREHFLMFAVDYVTRANRRKHSLPYPYHDLADINVQDLDTARINELLQWLTFIPYNAGLIC